ncbi:MAG: HAD family hydrolase, partial [Thermoplasmata archaeon]|nr:HAD family hydrolase [Thermoplasmata archaeon]
MIRGVLFDIGETLITSLETDEIFQLILREKGIEKSTEEIQKAHKNASARFRKRHGDIRPTGSGDFNKIYAEWDDEVMKDLGVKKKGMGTYINKRWFEMAGLKTFDDSVPVLKRLSAMGLRLGIVTNGYREEIDTILESLAKNAKPGNVLKNEMFDVIVGRDTAGASKPDPRPFLHAAGTLGLRPEEIIFVGDMYDKDYEGSLAVGMKPVLILRGKKLPKGVPDNIT